MAIPKTLPGIGHDASICQLPKTFSKMAQFEGDVEEDFCIAFHSAEDLEQALNT